MWKLIDKAIEAVPAARYALAVAGAIALFVMVGGPVKGIGGTFLAGIAILVLMIIMVLFAALASVSRAGMRPLALVLAWSFLLLFVGSAIAAASSLFFNQPKPFKELRDDLKSLVSTPEPTKSERVPVVDAACLDAKIESLKNRNTFSQAGGVSCRSGGASGSGETKTTTVSFIAPPGHQIVGQAEVAETSNIGGGYGAVQYFPVDGVVTKVSGEIHCSSPDKMFGPGGSEQIRLKGTIEHIVTADERAAAEASCTTP